jgi:hypothetical protein
METTMTFQPTLWTTARDFMGASLVCIAGAVALFAVTEPVRAESPPPYRSEYAHESRGPEPAWVACQPDARRYCPEVLPGGGRILSCLAGNRDRLTYDCRDALLHARDVLLYGR